MPSRARSSPPVSTASASWETRNQDWSNTANYPNVPKRSLPINTYVDIQRSYRQDAFDGWFYYVESDGSGPFFSQPASPHQQPFSSLESLMLDRMSYFGFNDSDGKLANEAMISALGKVADQKINLAVAFAEASKTVDLLTDTAGRIFRAYRAFRKRDLRGIASNLGINPKKLHKSWLEYKYGWMPLLMDVKGGAEALAQYHFGRLPEFSVTGTAKRDYNRTRQDTIGSYGGGPTVQTFNYFSGSLKCKVKIWLRIDNPHLTQAQQLGLTNPALIAWELTPFSFVFDWFISVGDYLQALTALQGVTVLKAMKSYEYDPKLVAGYPTFVHSTGGIRYHMSGETYDLKVRGYERSPVTVDAFSIYPPRKENPLNLQKVITSLALMRTLSSR